MTPPRAVASTATPAKRAGATPVPSTAQAKRAASAASAATTAGKSVTRAASASTAKRAPVAAQAAGHPLDPSTLAIDIGGTGLKASVLDGQGRIVADRVRVPTTYPMPPERLVDTLAKLVEPLPTADRVSAGFPGVVRKGIVVTAPHFVTQSGPGTKVVSQLAKKWSGFNLEAALTERLGIPVRVANDADLQGWAVVSGLGLEMVITLGTGVGSALFVDGRLAPHLELAHHPFRKGQTYNEQIGDAALLKIGRARWRKRVREAIGHFQVLVNYDRLYIGGGNAQRLKGHVDPEITIVDNVAGLLGGIKLWEHGWH